jgi:hypothetical protein
MNSGRLEKGEIQTNSINGQVRIDAQEDINSRTIPTQRLAPTQRVSEVNYSRHFHKWRSNITRFADCLMIDTREVRLR